MGLLGNVAVPAVLAVAGASGSVGGKVAEVSFRYSHPFHHHPFPYPQRYPYPGLSVTSFSCPLLVLAVVASSTEYHPFGLLR